MNKAQYLNYLAIGIKTSQIDAIEEKLHEHAGARETYARACAVHDNLFDVPEPPSVNRYTTKQTKLCTCPYSHLINKYIPYLGKNVRLVVPCGKCHFCLHRKQNAWIYRAYNHSQFFKYNYFVTLTFNPDNYPCESEHNFSHLQKFFKRFRKNNGLIRFSYFAVSEYGHRTHRFHYHFLYFSNTPLPRTLFQQKIEEAWNLGFVHVGALNNRTIAYVTKYSVKDFLKSHRCVSKHFGEAYLYSSQEVFDYFRYNRIIMYSPDGKKQYTVPIPKYYKDKVLTDGERYYLFSKYLDSPDYKHKFALVWEFAPDIRLHFYDLYNQYCVNFVESRERINNDIL